MDPNAVFFPDYKIKFDGSGCEQKWDPTKMAWVAINAVYDNTIHVYQAGFYGSFSASVSNSTCLGGLSAPDVHLNPGPNAWILIHGTKSVAGTTYCTLTVKGWNANTEGQASLSVYIGS